MFDFYFAKPEEIQKDEIGYLLTIKRMLPRWCNSIPDSEFTALSKLLDERGSQLSKEKKKYVIVETGSGASTIAIAYYALKYGGISFSWEMNGEKGSFLRKVCTETLCNVFNKNINEHWKLVAYASLSPHLGLPILPELVDHVNFFFQDSTHVLNTVLGEIKTVQEFLSDGDVIAIDDAFYDFIHTDIDYINIFRKKLGLKEIADPDNNHCKPFYVTVEEFLNNHWNKVESLSQYYKKIYREDIFFDYFSREVKIKRDAGVKRAEKLEKCFAAWRVSGRRYGL